MNIKPPLKGPATNHGQPPPEIGADYTGHPHDCNAGRRAGNGPGVAGLAFSHGCSNPPLELA
jgi:hypothetical protein